MVRRREIRRRGIRLRDIRRRDIRRREILRREIRRLEIRREIKHKTLTPRKMQSAQVPRANNLKAQWKSATKIEELRQENRCFRCEKQGCYARVCPLLPLGGTFHEKDVARPVKATLGPNSRPLRAIWKTVDQIDKLKMECRCFRCERQGCSTND